MPKDPLQSPTWIFQVNLIILKPSGFVVVCCFEEVLGIDPTALGVLYLNYIPSPRLIILKAQLQGPFLPPLTYELTLNQGLRSRDIV